MAVEWTITIEGRNDFGDICRKEVRIDKSWERLFDGDIGLSIEDGKKIMAALQSAAVNHEAETYTLFRRVCPDCHAFRPVKDYTTIQRETSSLLWPDVLAAVGANPVAAISRPAAPTRPQSEIERSTRFSKKGIAALATSP